MKLLAAIPKPVGVDFKACFRAFFVGGTTTLENISR